MKIRHFRTKKGSITLVPGEPDDVVTAVVDLRRDVADGDVLRALRTMS
jgi:hypothetical protein